MKSHIPHEMEHDVGVNKLQLHHGASNSVTSEQMFPLLTNEREGSQNLQHVSFIQLFFFQHSLLILTLFLVSISTPSINLIITTLKLHI